MPIKVLEPGVAGKIAAGEVVERPWSVAKELIENSMDAGSTQVTVEVKGGGTELIRVTDNGCGIPPDEVELAFQRHATSKVSEVSDLDSVSTLGFRGEALPSIAAVARVSLTTRPPDITVGREVQVSWGQVAKNSPAGCPEGTSVAVEGLFENLPARRKFLKSPSGETSRISDLVARYSLAFPEVRFRLLVDGRNSLNSPGNGSLADALVAVYGAETAGALLEVSRDPGDDGYGLRGYTSSPSVHRSNRSYATFLVNRRWVQSPLLSFALEQSYQGFLPDRRHPLAVLALTVPAGDLDVNVHPAKREVRFRQEDRAFSALQRAVRGALAETAPVPEMRLQGSPTPLGQAEEATGNPRLVPAAFGGERNTWDFAAGGTAPPIGATPVDAIPSLRVLGQVRSTYLVAEGADGLYLIDQHAAHERVLFERVSRDVASRSPQIQALLEPVPVELSPGQEELLRANLELLDDHGFLIEPFGDRSYLLRALPSVVKDSSPGQALLEVLDLMGYEGLVKEQDAALAASIACHSAVRAGMDLSPRETEELVRQLESCEAPHTCPHGRPTMIHLSSHHLDREFGRR